jgi:hypothetical protein
VQPRRFAAAKLWSRDDLNLEKMRDSGTPLLRCSQFVSERQRGIFVFRRAGDFTTLHMTREKPVS